MENFDNLPIAEPHGISDGWGVIGAGFECTKCNHRNQFVSFEAGDTLVCSSCGQEYYVDKDYDY